MCRILAREDHERLVLPLLDKTWNLRCERHVINGLHVNRARDGASFAIVTPHIDENASMAVDESVHFLGLQALHTCRKLHSPWQS